MFNFFKRKKEVNSSPSVSIKQIEPPEHMKAIKSIETIKPSEGVSQPTEKKIESISRSIEFFALENCPNNEDLRDLLLNHCKMGSDWVWWLSKYGLTRCPRLQHLWCYSCGFCEEDIKNLCREGLKLCPNLETLWLMTNYIDEIGVQHLCLDGLKNCPKLLNLELGGNKIGDLGVQFLCQNGLKLCPKLRSLGLYGNNIGVLGVKQLSQDGLKFCPQLITLKLSDNNISDVGVQYLSQEGLSYCPNLEELELSNNKISTVGAQCLFQKGLRNCPNLKQLQFSNNTMGDVGAQSLFQEGVRHCPNLEQLWVRYNNVTDVGVRYLYLEGLQHCPNLNLLAIDTTSAALQTKVQLCFNIVKFCPKLSRNLMGLELNTLTEALGIPAEFKQKNNEEILTYMRQQQQYVAGGVIDVKKEVALMPDIPLPTPPPTIQTPSVCNNNNESDISTRSSESHLNDPVYPSVAAATVEVEVEDKPTIAAIDAISDFTELHSTQTQIHTNTQQQHAKMPEIPDAASITAAATATATADDVVFVNDDKNSAAVGVMKALIEEQGRLRADNAALKKLLLLTQQKKPPQIDGIDDDQQGGLVVKGTQGTEETLLRTEQQPFTMDELLAKIRLNDDAIARSTTAIVKMSANF